MQRSRLFYCLMRCCILVVNCHLKGGYKLLQHLSLWANLSEEAKTSDIAEAGCTYKLYALIFHRSGVSTSSGHYNAYCRVGQDDKKDWWAPCSDSD